MTKANTVLFEKICILGVGLMGGSLAAAAKRAGVVGAVSGWGRNPDNLSRAQALGYIDEWSTDLQEAMDGADLIVVATPTQFAEQLMVQALKLAKGSAIVTDVASVKGNLLAALKAEFGELPNNAVLGHPIAGSEKSGVEAIDPDLYAAHQVILIESEDKQSLSRVAELWRALDADVSFMDVVQHDAVLALTSHLPHVLAYALIEQIASSRLSDDVFAFAAGGFRDFSRIAGSDPTMWAEILMANRDEILVGLEQYNEQLQKIRKGLEERDPEVLKSIFSNAQKHRNQFAKNYEQRIAQQTKHR